MSKQWDKRSKVPDHKSLQSKYGRGIHLCIIFHSWFCLMPCESGPRAHAHSQRFSRRQPHLKVIFGSKPLPLVSYGIIFKSPKNLIDEISCVGNDNSKDYNTIKSGCANALYRGWGSKLYPLMGPKSPNLMLHKWVVSF